MPKNPAAVALGTLGGKAKSEKKTKSSRENGRLGGRPKKNVDKLKELGIVPVVSDNPDI